MFNMAFEKLYELLIFAHFDPIMFLCMMVDYHGVGNIGSLL